MNMTGVNPTETEQQKNIDIQLLNLFNTSGGFGLTTSIERTAFGKHFDHVDSFYTDLTSDQKDAFLHPAHQDQDLKNFESLLNPSLLDRWQDLKDEAHELGGSYDPQNTSDIELAASSLRTMMDNYPSSDPGTKLVQDHMIESLGGTEAVLDIIQTTLDPELGAEALPPEIKDTLLSGQQDTYAFSTATNENNGQEVVEIFFNGQPIELVATSDGGVKLPGDSPDPVINNDMGTPETTAPSIPNGL